MGNKNTDYGLQYRQVVYERDGHKCVYCGSSIGLTLDHVIPVSKGGAYCDADNLVAACGPCNNAKSNMSLHEWIVSKHQLLLKRAERRAANLKRRMELRDRVDMQAS